MWEEERMEIFWRLLLLMLGSLGMARALEMPPPVDRYVGICIWHWCCYGIGIRIQEGRWPPHSTGSLILSQPGFWRCAPLLFFSFLPLSNYTLTITHYPSIIFSAVNAIVENKPLISGFMTNLCAWWGDWARKEVIWWFVLYCLFVCYRIFIKILFFPFNFLLTTFTFLCRSISEDSQLKNLFASKQNKTC